MIIILHKDEQILKKNKKCTSSTGGLPQPPG
jgi:hypothetical protein